MGKWEYTRGLHDLGKGIYAYLQPDGSWGWSNAGLIVGGNESLLVDTLFDLVLTREMLDAMRAASKAADSIDTLVITHANGDHYYGSQLVEGAEIIASKACAEELDESPPQMLAQLAKNALNMGELGDFFIKCFGQFKFDGITPLKPTRTFEKRMDITVGNKEVQLIQVGPAHTKGDVIAYVPEAGVVFAADILFIGGTPIMWAGPVANWIRACDLMLEMDAEIFVPGHGPITDKQGVEAVKGYWEYVTDEARKRYDAGMSAGEAIADIDLGEYSSWGESERIAVNVNTLFKEFSGDSTPANVIELFGTMAKLGLKK
jgi:cyclase